MYAETTWPAWWAGRESAEVFQELRQRRNACSWSAYLLMRNLTLFHKPDSAQDKLRIRRYALHLFQLQMNAVLIDVTEVGFVGLGV